MFRYNQPGPSCALLPWALRVLEALKETALGGSVESVMRKVALWHI